MTEAELLEGVEHHRHRGGPVEVHEVLDEVGGLTLGEGLVQLRERDRDEFLRADHVLEGLADLVVEDDPAGGGDAARAVLGVAQLDDVVDGDRPLLERGDDVVRRAERLRRRELQDVERLRRPLHAVGLALVALRELPLAALGVPEVGQLALEALALVTLLADVEHRTVGQVVEAEDHLLRGHRDRPPVRRRQDVVGRQHQDARLGLRLHRQGEVDGHLVAVEVGVERRADERVDLDGLALDQHGLEGLDAEAVQGRGAVEQHRVLPDDLLQHVPDLGHHRVDQLLGRLDVLDLLALDQAAHDERLEELEGHQLRQAALVQAQLGAGHDDRAARIVDALAEQVLTEAALLALEHVGERLQRPVARAGDGAPAPAVVEERVDGLLQHPLLVVHDDLGRAEVEEPLEAVVAVDDAAVQVVQVAGGEAATVELHHRAQLRRDDRDRLEHHPLGAVGAAAERGGHLEALQGARLALALGGLDGLAQRLGLGVEVDLAEQLADRRGAHAALEEVGEAVGRAEPLAHLAEQLLVRLDLARLEVLEGEPGAGEAVDRLLRVALDVLQRDVGLLAEVGLGLLAVGVGQLAARLGVLVGAVALEVVDPVVVLVGEARGLALAQPLHPAVEALAQLEQALLLVNAELLDGGVDLVLEAVELARAALLVDLGHDRGGEVEDLLQLLGGDVQHVADPARDALEEPDVADGRGQVDVAHALAADLRPRHLDAAALADDALVADALVLTAVALPVLGRTEDLLAEEAVLLGLQRAVVDGLGLGDLARAPLPDLLGGGQTDGDGVEIVDVDQCAAPFSCAGGRTALARRPRGKLRPSSRRPAAPGPGGPTAAGRRAPLPLRRVGAGRLRR